MRLIVERERERIAFVDATYWDLEAVFETAKNESLSATLATVDGRKIPTGKDFDSATGKLKNSKLLQLNEQQANDLAAKLRSADFKVTKVEVKPFTERPRPPFTTSTLQQEANRKLGFTAQRTMSAAQRLYENGYITYMRTDSTTLSKEAIGAARTLVRSEYGENFLHPDVRVYKTKEKNAQEAHEAIRPAGTPFRVPETVRGELDSDQFRVFDLIWKRTIACQMADAKKQRVSITIEGGGATFTASGTSILFEGFLRAYVEGSDNPEAELANKETILPQVKESDPLSAKSLDPKSHTTQPPARFTEASLTRTLEEKGIGRPSTYASIIGTITDERRNYIFKKGSALVPTWRAFSVTRLMEDHFGTLVDYEFTAELEDFLDSISRDEACRDEYLKKFYFGDDSEDKHNVGLKSRLVEKLDEIDPKETARFPLGTPTEGEHRDPVFVRVGKYGPYIEQGERTGFDPRRVAARRNGFAESDGAAGVQRSRGGAAGDASRNGQADLRQSGSLRPVHPAGRTGRRGETKSGLAEGDGGRGPDAGDWPASCSNCRERWVITRKTGSRSRPLTGDMDPTSSAKRRHVRCRPGCHRWRSRWKRRSRC